MARIVGGSMIGELSGKMGGMVFSRNRGGQYIRAYAIPVNPNTLAQVEARTFFGMASANYHSLASATKTLWQNFATNIFNPKMGIKGVPSGFNSYVALKNVLSNLNPISAFTVQVNEDPTLVPVSNVFSFSDVPPANGLQPNIKAVTTGSYAIENGQIGSVTFAFGAENVSIGATFTANLVGTIGATGGISSFKDAEGNAFGVSLFLSNAVAQPGMFIQNPEIIKLGTVPLLASFTAEPTPDTFSFTFSGHLLVLADYNAFPQLGQYARITAYLTSTKGMMLKIATTDIQISDED